MVKSVGALLLGGCVLAGCSARRAAESERMDGAVVFADGVIVRDVRVPAGPVRPGAAVSVSFVASASQSFEVRLEAPRVAGRQVARGGVDAPPLRAPSDARTQVHVVTGTELSATFELPDRWHARTAVVRVRRCHGRRCVRAVAGPRSHDGAAVLAVLDVEPAPTRVQALRMHTPSIDGELFEWGAVSRTTLVHARDGEPVRLGATREDAPDWGPTEVAWGWDDVALYLAAWLPDRDVQGTHTRHDDPLWEQEVLELFVFGDAGPRRYLELQISPLGTTFDAKFDGHRKGDRTWTSTFASAVAVRGTVEDASDRDEGWTAELAVPWQELCSHTEITCPPVAGASFRANVFRIERTQSGAMLGLGLSPTRVPDFHSATNAAVVELLP